MSLFNDNLAPFIFDTYMRLIKQDIDTHDLANNPEYIKRSFILINSIAGGIYQHLEKPLLSRIKEIDNRVKLLEEVKSVSSKINISNHSYHKQDCIMNSRKRVDWTKPICAWNDYTGECYPAKYTPISNVHCCLIIMSKTRKIESEVDSFGGVNTDDGLIIRNF